MKRGLINLTQAQHNYLQQMVADHDWPDNLKSKLLLPADPTQTTVSLELNRDQIENILDSLPAPNSAVDAASTQIRQILTKFIGS